MDVGGSGASIPATIEVVPSVGGADGATTESVAVPPLAGEANSEWQVASEATARPATPLTPISAGGGGEEGTASAADIERVRRLTHEKELKASAAEDQTGNASQVDRETAAGQVGRKPLVCVLGVPNHMTYADFCRFCGSFIQHMLEMRIVRNDEIEDTYIVLIRFDNQESTDGFYKHFNGQKFSSLEPEACRVLFIIDVQYMGSIIGHGQTSLVNSTEQPTCPVCLERLDQETGGILTTICNHSFHCSCISKWTDSSCPVCRYCQQQPEKSTCFICETSENLWICVICGFVGCGRYKEGHAIMHWKETQHCYSLDLETRRVWDYVGDNYVHRLIQSKTDGKLVELNVPCSHDMHGCGSCECSEDPGVKEAILSSKVEAIVNEYNELLSTQLENKKLYFESLLQEVKDETEREIDEAIEKAVSLKFQKLQAKLDRCIKEKKFLDDINENLLKNQEIWKVKIQEIVEREEKALRLQDDKIRDLKEQLKDLMLHLEADQAVLQISLSDDVVNDGSVLKIGDKSSSTGASSKSKNRKKR